CASMQLANGQPGDAEADAQQWQPIAKGMQPAGCWQHSTVLQRYLMGQRQAGEDGTDRRCSGRYRDRRQHQASGLGLHVADLPTRSRTAVFVQIGANHLQQDTRLSQSALGAGNMPSRTGSRRRRTRPRQRAPLRDTRYHRVVWSDWSGKTGRLLLAGGTQLLAGGTQCALSAPRPAFPRAPARPSRRCGRTAGVRARLAWTAAWRFRPRS
ncbi:MAG: hypothetical protein ACI85K_001738, partial [Hyphomicrobiaceae bacterium]